MKETIKEAVDRATNTAIAIGVAPSQARMVGCLAVKDKMPDTLENLKALQVEMAKCNTLVKR